MRFTQGLLRTPGPDCAAGLTSAGLGAPDYAVLLEQHAAYRKALESLGLECTVLDPLPGAPDAYFVEDAAVVTPELAIVTRPGTESRRMETVTIERALSGAKAIARITEPGTVDGGDVFLVGQRCYIGLSERTNEAGAEQLARHLAGVGIDSIRVPVPSGLHLKSSVNYLGQNRLLLTAEFESEPAFDTFERIVAAPEENYAANTLWINGTLLLPRGYPGIQGRLQEIGYPLVTLEMSEVAKMDGGLSCLSLRF